MQRIILHLDLDYFYAQIEESRKPDIKNKPVVVCQYSGRSEDSGAVATTNYIARKFNVKSGLPIKTAKKLLQNTDSVFIAANHELYESVSEAIMNIIRRYSDKFEQLSIDEACIDISNKTNNDYQSASTYGNELKKEIKTLENLTCSIGIGPNKLISKMAADSNKPNGTTVILPDKVKDFLFPQKVNKLYGIGPKTNTKLAEFNITTIEDLANSERTVLIDEFGQKFGVYLHDSANGIDNEEVKDKPADQIGRIVTLKEDTRDFDLISQSIDNLSKDISNQTIDKKITFKTVSITAIMEDLTIYQRSKSFEIFQNSNDIIVATSKELLRNFLSQESRKLRRIGVRVSNFSQTKGQTNLFDFNS
ncbi:MAG: DNA polymerase IV [Chloroflexi bacterium]|nr:DNA polymerase IV [Chloroflexota bacterium]|tara:strand:- start:16836 stop:17924 length:1089 start_codon:yes stop_codon:yes gene_type:complete